MKNINRLWRLLESELGTDFEGDPEIQKNVRALSKSFTEGRSHLSAHYLSDRWARQAYLAYFVPLNFHKTLLLLRAHGVKLGLTWCDFGSGPATSTLAALAWLSESGQYNGEEIVITLVDLRAEALQLAERLVRNYASDLKIKVKVRGVKFLKEGRAEPPFDFSMASNVLNELSSTEPLSSLWAQTRGSFFILEPSHRVSSQKLIRFRWRLLTDDKSPVESAAEPVGLTDTPLPSKTTGRSIEVIGPCFHSEQCPLFRSKHWCHFSERVIDPQMIILNESIFRDPRAWLKFSYLLVGRPGSALEPPPKGIVRYRAIGDLHPSGPGRVAIDLCQPNEKLPLRLSSKTPRALTHKLVRGAEVCLKKEKIVRATPLTPATINNEI